MVKLLTDMLQSEKTNRIEELKLIDARHAREMEGARPVPASRALVTENAVSAVALHALNNGAGGMECLGEITSEIVGAIQ